MCVRENTLRDGGVGVRVSNVCSIDGFVERASPRDLLDYAQRTADALISLLSGGHKGASVTLVIDLAALHRDELRRGARSPGAQSPGARRRHESRPDEAARHRSDDLAAVLTERLTEPPVARLTGEGEISAERARQIALAAGLSPLIMGEGSVPLYLGHKVRFVSPRQRQVLLAMYDTCRVDGCAIPAYACEMHHLKGVGSSARRPASTSSRPPARSTIGGSKGIPVGSGMSPIRTAGRFSPSCPPGRPPQPHDVS